MQTLPTTGSAPLYGNGSCKQTRQQERHRNKSCESGIQRAALYVSRHHSQEHAAGQEQEQWVLHQAAVGQAEPRQAGVGVLHLSGPQLPRLKHGGEVPEGAAPFRGLNPADGQIKKKMVKWFDHSAKAAAHHQLYKSKIPQCYLENHREAVRQPRGTLKNYFDFCRFSRRWEAEYASVSNSMRDMGDKSARI